MPFSCPGFTPSFEEPVVNLVLNPLYMLQLPSIYWKIISCLISICLVWTWNTSSSAGLWKGRGKTGLSTKRVFNYHHLQSGCNFSAAIRNCIYHLKDWLPQAVTTVLLTNSKYEPVATSMTQRCLLAKKKPAGDWFFLEKLPFKGN